MLKNVYENSVRKNLKDAIEHYIGHMLGHDLTKMAHKRLNVILNNVISFLTWCNMKRAQIKGNSIESSTYEELMPAVLALYVDIILNLSKIMPAKKRLEESSTILLKTSLILSGNVQRYLDVMLRIRYMDATHLDLLKPLCRQCLKQKLNTDPEAYTKLVILRRKLSSLWPKELSDGIFEASMLLPPRNYLKWLERKDRDASKLLNVLTLKDDKNIRDSLMGSRADIRALEAILCKLLPQIKIQATIEVEWNDSDLDNVSHRSNDTTVQRNNRQSGGIKGSFVEEKSAITKCKVGNDTNGHTRMDIDEEDVQVEDQPLLSSLVGKSRKRKHESEDDDNDNDSEEEEMKHQIKKIKFTATEEVTHKEQHEDKVALEGEVDDKNGEHQKEVDDRNGEHQKEEVLLENEIQVNNALEVISQGPPIIIEEVLTRGDTQMSEIHSDQNALLNTEECNENPCESSPSANNAEADPSKDVSVEGSRATYCCGEYSNNIPVDDEESVVTSSRDLLLEEPVNASSMDISLSENYREMHAGDYDILESINSSRVSEVMDGIGSSHKEAETLMAEEIASRVEGRIASSDDQRVTSTLVVVEKQNKASKRKRESDDEESEESQKGQDGKRMKLVSPVEDVEKNDDLDLEGTNYFDDFEVIEISSVESKEFDHDESKLISMNILEEVMPPDEGNIFNEDIESNIHYREILTDEESEKRDADHESSCSTQLTSIAVNSQESVSSTIDDEIDVQTDSHSSRTPIKISSFTSSPVKVTAQGLHLPQPTQNDDTPRTKSSPLNDGQDGDKISDQYILQAGSLPATEMSNPSKGSHTDEEYERDSLETDEAPIANLKSIPRELNATLSSSVKDTESHKEGEDDESAQKDVSQSSLPSTNGFQDSKGSSCQAEQVSGDEPKKYSLRRGKAGSNLKNIIRSLVSPKIRARKPASKDPESKVLSKDATDSSKNVLKGMRTSKAEQSSQENSSQSSSSVIQSKEEDKATSRIPRWMGKSGDESSVTSDASNVEDGALTLRRSARIKDKGPRHL